MSVRKIGIGSWYSTLTEQTYDSETAALHYDKLERQKLTLETPEEKFLNSLSTEQVKMFTQQKQAWAEQVQGKIDWKHAQQEFVNLNPDYLPNEVNGRTLAAALVALGKVDPVADVFLGTMEDMQEAYIDLAQKGMLKLRPGAPVPQRAAKAAEADPADPYTLPLEELRGRARGW
jgi:hypothetical protein